MSVSEMLHVQIGQVKVAGAGQVLTAILGSCIGLGFLWPKRGIYGLAHALLAKSADSATNDGSGRHVDHAIETLLDMMKVPQDNKRELSVILAGGANMTLPAGTDPARLVGTLNAEFAVQAVRAARLRLIHEDLGGEHGRRVSIDCTSGAFTIDAIPRLGGQT